MRTFQRFARVAEKKEHNGTNKKYDTRMDLNQGTRLVALMLYRLSYSVRRQNPNFNPYKLSNLQFIPLLSFLHVDFLSTCCLVNSVSFHNCPRLIPIQSNPIKIPASVRFLICSVAFFLLCYPCEATEGPISTRVCIF